MTGLTLQYLLIHLLFHLKADHFKQSILHFYYSTQQTFRHNFPLPFYDWRGPLQGHLSGSDGLWTFSADFPHCKAPAVGPWHPHCVYQICLALIICWFCILRQEPTFHWGDLSGQQLMKSSPIVKTLAPGWGASLVHPLLITSSPSSCEPCVLCRQSTDHCALLCLFADFCLIC